MTNNFIEPEIFYTKLAGVTFEGRQQVLQVLERLEKTNKDKVKLILRREPENQYDSHAIAVDATYYDDTFLSEVTRQAGYIRKEVAVDLSDDLENGYDFVVLDFETTGGYQKARGINIKILRKGVNMPTITALDLLQKKSGERVARLKLSPGAAITVRFLKPLAEAFVQVTHSIKMPDGRYERFASPQYLNGVGDESIEDPAMTIDPNPWTKLVLPVIDRADGRVKLFEETVATFRKLKMFEEDPKNDMEKQIKLGSLTNADITIMQQGVGRERQVTAFPNPGTIRPLNAEEKKLKVPNPKDFQKVLTKEEIQAIVSAAAGVAQTPSQAMNVQGPFPG